MDDVMQAGAATGYTIPIRRVQAFLALALRRGWEIEPILESAGISPTLLAEGRSRVTTEQIATVLKELWASTDDELMGLGPTPVPHGTFRLVAHALLATAHDVDTMLTHFVEFNRALPGVPGVDAARGPDETVLSFDLSTIDQPIALLIDVLLAASHRLLEWSIGQRIRLRRIEMPYGRPDDVDDYDQIFGAPVVFDAPAAALIVDSALLKVPTVRDENDVTEFLTHPAESLLIRNYGVSLAHQVRQMTARSVGGAWPTADDIAARMIMSPQTLRRKLREENTSVRQIREEILRDAAIQSLSRGQETIAALSERLGFSEPSAFTRAFRRWTGSAPRSYQPRGAD